MNLLSLTRRGVVLAVALHLAALPVAASLHAASHYRYESGIALEHDEAPCPEPTRSPHHTHLSGVRGDAGDLLCAFCHLFQHGLRHHNGAAAFQMDAPLTQAIVPSYAGAILRSGVSCSLPQGRAPPVQA